MSFFQKTAWIFTLFAVGCGSEKITVPKETDYFPLQTGTEFLFQRTLTTFRQNGNQTDTLKNIFYIKEKITETYVDSEGRTRFKVEIDSSETADGNFAAYSSGFKFKHRGECVSSIENKTLVVLEYPLNAGKNWNGNKYNSEGIQLFTLKDLNYSLTVSGKNFQKCAFTEQFPFDSSFLSVRQAFEIFAPDLGCVRRYDKNIRYITTGTPGEPVFIDPVSSIIEDKFISR